MTFKVQKKMCDECLFSENKVVGNSRRDQIIKDAVREQSHFICHKSQLKDGKGDVCCRAYYDQLGHHSQMIRICERIGAIEFVEVE